MHLRTVRPGLYDAVWLWGEPREIWEPGTTEDCDEDDAVPQSSHGMTTSFGTFCKSHLAPKDTSKTTRTHTYTRRRVYINHSVSFVRCRISGKVQVYFAHHPDSSRNRQMLFFELLYHNIISLQITFFRRNLSALFSWLQPAGHKCGKSSELLPLVGTGRYAHVGQTLWLGSQNLQEIISGKKNSA